MISDTLNAWKRSDKRSPPSLCMWWLGGPPGPELLKGKQSNKVYKQRAQRGKMLSTQITHRIGKVALKLNGKMKMYYLTGNAKAQHTVLTFAGGRLI